MTGMDEEQVLLNNYLREVPSDEVEWGIVTNAYIRLGDVDSATEALEHYCLTNPE